MHPRTFNELLVCSAQASSKIRSTYPCGGGLTISEWYQICNKYHATYSESGKRVRTRFIVYHYLRFTIHHLPSISVYRLSSVIYSSLGEVPPGRTEGLTWASSPRQHHLASSYLGIITQAPPKTCFGRTKMLKPWIRLILCMREAERFALLYICLQVFKHDSA